MYTSLLPNQMPTYVHRVSTSDQPYLTYIGVVI